MAAQQEVVVDIVAIVFAVIATVAEIFGLALLTVGFVRGAIGWLRIEAGRKPWEKRFGPLRNLRCIVGIHILYALELMIVSDIITSFLAVVEHEGDGGNFFQGGVFASLMQLGMVVAIRTVIDTFLGREIAELKSERADG